MFLSVDKYKTQNTKCKNTRTNKQQLLTDYLRLILESKGTHVIFQKKGGGNVKKGQNIWKFRQKCTTFENILEKGS